MSHPKKRACQLNIPTLIRLSIFLGEGRGGGAIELFFFYLITYYFIYLLLLNVEKLITKNNEFKRKNRALINSEANISAFSHVFSHMFQYP